jgi:2,4-dienoyl-CoA reductase-like NADH-dependent reductase (Old Yellow Enzyme family)
MLASSFSVAGLNLPNRIVMPPLVIWKSDETGLVLDAHRAHYEATLGPGLMVVEATAVSPEGRLAASQLGIWSDEHVSGLSDLAQIIHRSGAMAGIQIHHAGSKSTLKHTCGLPPLVVSLDESSPEGAVELTEPDIIRIAHAFADAAVRAERAGFDYVELHAAHGYLMSQFLSARANARRDAWGGSLDNRMKFILDTYRLSREAVGDQTVIAVRLGLSDGRADGITPQDGIAVARELTALGCPILNISHGGGSVSQLVPSGFPYSGTIHLASLVKDVVATTVIGVGEIFTADQAEAVLKSGVADLVAAGRALLADPGWADKIVSGREAEIEQCVDCRPRCFHFKEPEACPARIRLARDGGVAAPGV